MRMQCRCAVVLCGYLIAQPGLFESEFVFDLRDLEVEDDRPNQAESQLPVPLYDVFGSDVDELDLKIYF